MTTEEEGGKGNCENSDPYIIMSIVRHESGEGTRWLRVARYGHHSERVSSDAKSPRSSLQPLGLGEPLTILSYLSPCGIVVTAM